jgi:hypothetical protein
MVYVHIQRAIGLALAAMAAMLTLVTPVVATPRAAIAVVEVMGPPNPETIALRDGKFSSDIAIGAAAGAGSTPADPSKLQNLKLGDELGLAVQKAFAAKGVVAYLTGADPHPWPTSALQISIDDARYERRLEESKIGPNLLVRFRLYDGTTRDRLAGDTYMYDMYAQTIGRTILRPPEEFGFDKKEDLQAHPEVMLAALRKGIDMIAQQIVTDILADIDD